MSVYVAKHFKAWTIVSVVKVSYVAKKYILLNLKNCSSCVFFMQLLHVNDCMLKDLNSFIEHFKLSEVGKSSRTPYLLQGSRFSSFKRMRMGRGMPVRPTMHCTAGRAGPTSSWQTWARQH